MSIKKLRISELVIFGLPAAFFLMLQHRVTLEDAGRGVMPPPVPFWLLLIFTYGMFIPNTWRRAALVIGAMALAPILLVAGMMLAYPKVAAVMTVVGIMQHVLVLLVAAVASVVGTHLINTLRREVFEARQLGQYRLAEAARRRRHGRGLPGRAPHAQTAVRNQADSSRSSRRSARLGPLRARGSA